jgi:hypothetical protein
MKTKKVVINNCYGGFSLSFEAILELVGKCEHVKLLAPERYFGRKMSEADIRDEKNKPYQLSPWKDDMIIHDGHRECGRDCPALVETVERLGKKSDGQMAALKIVEIPADVDFVIEEYDGAEWVAERHRTWS